MAKQTLLRRSFALASALVAAAQDCSQTCQSYGLDFVDGGSYFQNIASNANFTAFEDFSGCQNDLADNILVSPEGDQYFCNDTPMQPDQTPQEIICPIEKSQLTSGEWSLIILSNNGACNPIDYIRSFSLSVGTQVTTTVPITVTVTSTTAPATSVTIPVTQFVTTTAREVTATVSGTFARTRTITPLPSLTITTRGLIQLTQTSLQANVVGTTTFTPPCPTITPLPFRARIADVINSRISVTLSGLRATAGLHLAARNAHPVPTARSGSTEHRRARLAGSHQLRDTSVDQVDSPRVYKRSPDAPTITVQDGAAGTSTSTVVQTQPLTTVSVISTVLSTSTLTPTVTYNPNAQRTETITVAAKTKTLTLWIPLAFTTVTSQQNVVATVTAAPTCA